MSYDPGMHGFCSEFYTVVKTIEVVAPVGDDDKQIRIEVLSLDNSPSTNLHFTTRAYIWEYINKEAIPESHHARGCWVDFDLPSSNSAGSPEKALNSALGFLKNKSKK